MRFELNFKEIVTNEDIVTWHGDCVPRINEYVVLRSEKYAVKEVKYSPPGDGSQVIEVSVRKVK